MAPAVVRAFRTPLVAVILGGGCCFGIGKTAQSSPRGGANEWHTGSAVTRSACVGGVLWGRVLRLRGKPVYRLGESVVFEPLTGAVVSALGPDEGGGRQVEITDDSGSYRFCLSPGEYRVEIVPEPGWWSKDVPRLVEMATDHEVRLDIRIESGIR